MYSFPLLGRYKDDPTEQEKYLPAEESEKFIVHIDENKRLKNTDDKTCHGIMICVLEGPNFYAAKKPTNKHHSYFVSGRNVEFAGELKTLAGTIIIFTNGSGHYRPNSDYLLEALIELTKQHRDTDYCVYGIPLIFEDHSQHKDQKIHYRVKDIIQAGGVQNATPLTDEERYQYDDAIDKLCEAHEIRETKTTGFGLSIEKVRYHKEHLQEPTSSSETVKTQHNFTEVEVIIDDNANTKKQGSPTKYLKKHSAPERFHGVAKSKTAKKLELGELPMPTSSAPDSFFGGTQSIVAGDRKPKAANKSESEKVAMPTDENNNENKIESTYVKDSSFANTF